MPFIKLKVEASPSLDDIARPFRNFREQTIDDRLDDLTDLIHNKIRQEAPVRTGELRRSIVKRKRARFNYDILVDRRMRGGKYEVYVRMGVTPERRNPIFPRIKKALYWPGARHPVRAVYNHPGMKANPYWDKGLDRAAPDIRRAEELLATEIERSLTQ